MFCQKPFTALSMDVFAADSRILSGGHVVSPLTAVNDPIQNGGWLARIASAQVTAGVDVFADAGLYRYGQSYGGTTP
jgi:hypothetical protein